MSQHIHVRQPPVISQNAICSPGDGNMVFSDGGGGSVKLAELIEAQNRLTRVEAALITLFAAFEAQLAAVNPDHLAQCPACAALLALRNGKVLDELEKSS